MPTNEERKALYNKIIETLSNDGVVTMSTYGHTWEYEKKHLDWFKLGKNGVYVKRGKNWDCIDLCGFRFYQRIAS